MQKLKYKLNFSSYAPPITEEQLQKYESLIDTAPVRVQEYMRDLVAMLRLFWETEESKLPPVSNKTGVFYTPLEEAEISRIWDAVPYRDECDLIGKVFDTLPDGFVQKRDPEDPTALKNEITDQAAFDLKCAANHLLWYAYELTADREPITQDKVQ